MSSVQELEMLEKEKPEGFVPAIANTIRVGILAGRYFRAVTPKQRFVLSYRVFQAQNYRI